MRSRQGWRNKRMASGAVLLVIFLCLLVSAAVAADSEATNSIVIKVQGVGDARITPDTAMVWLGIQQEGEDASSALRSSYAVVEQIMEIFLEYGPRDRIKTSEFFLYRSERWDNAKGESFPGPFVVRHVFEVPVEELERAAEMIDRAVEAGANVIQNIQYAVKDTQNASADAYRRALDNARWKAEVLAPAGTRLEMVSIVDSYSTSPMFAAEGGAAVTDLASVFMPGQLKVSVTLDVTFRAIPVTH